MVDDQLQRRRKLYFELSSRIALISNARLRSLLDNSSPHTGWGKHQIIDLGTSRVFVKRVMVTDIEYDNIFSTCNLYDLPTFYNYGYGSAGLGVFRELVTHIKTTNWVLEGAITTFPLMYHYRILPFDGPRAQTDMEQHARYVDYWGGSDNVGRYMLDRASGTHEMVLFLEYIPHTVALWLLDHPAKLHMVLDDMQATVAFLRAHGILHLDAHFYNMLTDGKRAYLTDFGLALDKQFELTPAERDFYRRNSHYDYGLLLWNLGAHLVDIYESLPDAERNRISDRIGLTPKAKYEEQIAALLKHVNELASSGILKLDRSLLSSLEKYRSIITFIHEFFWSMRLNNAKDTKFDHAQLKRLLREAGVV
jgi:hypothetical protein